jgi:8-oxo-dGTP diphosphatase
MIIAEIKNNSSLSQLIKYRRYNGRMITKSSLILLRINNTEKELMFVRAKEKQHYVFPGGKQEPNESINQALYREIKEELGANIKNVEKIGFIMGQTPDGRDLEMYLYSAELLNEPVADSEIEEIRWMSRQDIDNYLPQMTPMTIEHVLPFLLEKKLF